METFCRDHGYVRETLGDLKRGQQDQCETLEDINNAIKQLTEELRKTREAQIEVKAKNPVLYWGARGGGIAGIAAAVDYILKKVFGT